jgi:hypothetical protein
MNTGQNIGKMGPVVIGGVGGSGTRVFAEIAMNLGCYMGKDINKSNDNLWFTLLFKRPEWFRKHQTDGDIIRGLQIFEKIMLNDPISFNDLAFLIGSTLATAIHGNDHLGAGKGKWAFERLINILFGGKHALSGYLRWGWKEPNSHIYIRHLNKYFKKMKFILVIRHGLDIAFSANRAQLYNWGPMLGVSPPINGSPLLPQAMLKYWLKANQRALSLGKSLLKDDFIVLRYEDLCKEPEKVINEIKAFLGLNRENIPLSIIAHIKSPKSIGRYKNENLGIFPEEDMETLRTFGYRI